MIILAANVLSEVLKAQPAPAVLAWLDRQPKTRVALSAISLFEARFGLERIREKDRRTTLNAALDAYLRVDLKGRVLPFDTAAAEKTAALMANRANAGKPMEFRDGMIAGLVLARNATLATRNVKDFEGTNVTVVNPWTA